jgi:hypothetical protein
VTNIAQLNAIHTTSPQPASPLLPFGRERLEPEVFHVNVQMLRNYHLPMAFAILSGHNPYV